MKRESNWTPRALPNGVYCSPRCGASCKRKDYERAVAKSEKVAKALGPGWKPEVWENMGWFWRVTKGDFEVSQYRDESKYSATFQGHVQKIAEGPTPRKALEAVTHRVRELIAILEHQVETGK